MKISKKIQAFLETAKQQDSYWVEKAKLDFALSLEQQRRLEQLSYSDIASKIATSAAYITKVFRGDSNLTIESMVKLSRATGGELDIRIVKKDAKPAVTWDFSKFKRHPKLHVIVSNTTTAVPYGNASNHGDYGHQEESAA